jgi:hypothetical protein
VGCSENLQRSLREMVAGAAPERVVQMGPKRVAGGWHAGSTSGRATRATRRNQLLAQEPIHFFARRFIASCAKRV